MVPQALHLCDGLGFDGLQEGGPARVVAAAEHEVVPDQDPELVAGSVEGVFFPDAAAPDSGAWLVLEVLGGRRKGGPDHDLVAVDHEL